MSPRLTADSLQRALAKSAPAAAYYIHGAETILKDEAVATLIDAILDPGLRDFNLDLLSAQTLDPEQLAAVCSSLPMMADRRVVVVRDVEAWKRKPKAKLAAAHALTELGDTTVAILVQGNDDAPDGELAKPCTMVDCAAPTGQALDAWLDDRLADSGVVLEPEAREHLLRATAGDLGLLAAECAKLAGLGGSKALDRDTVGALVGIRFGETADDWRDAVLRDDLATSARILPRLLEQSGTSGVRLVMLLGSSLLALQWGRATAEARRIKGAPLASAVKTLCFESRPMVGSYDPFARLVGEVVGRWSLPRIDQAVRATLAADVALKSTTVSGEAAILTDLTLNLAVSRSRKAA
ncbi:MAG: DNA polymerase III subunit delta [Gemmatimonadales bacterium]|nr:DNA polymerase III subunit delta [Gemmatimonadales bacterium]MDZ4390901.1 DNA polymerase III subunit delta [Gemmatimonadales bacterium]